MAVTLTCGFPSWWDLQRGSRAVDGWDWEAFVRVQGGKEYDRIMDTKPRCLPGSLLKTAQQVRLIGNGWR